MRFRSQFLVVITYICLTKYVDIAGAQDEVEWLRNSEDNGSGCAPNDPECEDVESGDGVDSPPRARAEIPNPFLQTPVNHTVRLYGNRSTDDHLITTYKWDQLNGPPVKMSDLWSENLNIHPPLESGKYAFRLTVMDSLGQTHFDVVQFFVDGFVIDDEDDSGSSKSKSEKNSKSRNKPNLVDDNRVPEEPPEGRREGSSGGMTRITGCDTCKMPADGSSNNGRHSSGESDMKMDTITLALIIAGGAAGLIVLVLCIGFIIHRVRKKDEGSYALDEPKRSPLVNQYAKTSPKEFYA